MSGIAGFAGHEGTVQSYYGAAGAMLETLSRRGSDKGDLVFSKGACLLHRGSAVPDEGQPLELSFGEKRLTICMSGDLFNAEEVRRTLTEKGHTFRSASGAEVMLTAYAEWGGDCLKAFNGNYALAIWDEEAETLFCARDRLGVKPFFYALAEGKFIFASLIKTLLAHPLVIPSIGRESAAELLLIGPGRTPGYGIFQDVRELPPGHSALFSRNGLSVMKYYEINAYEHTESPEETADHVRTLVLDSIRGQLGNKTAVSAFLSGGLDSSLLSAVAARETDGRLRTYSVDYHENDKYFTSSYYQPNSDKEFIQRMTSYLGCPHTTLELGTEELAQSLYRAVDARDLPGMADVDGSLLLFCEEVAKHETTALSGECADEIFGGYPWYRDEKLRAIDGFPWSQSTLYRAEFLREDLLYALDPAAYVYVKYRDTLSKTVRLEGEDGTNRRVREIMRLNLDWFMQTLIDRTDRMAGYAGLEVLVPYCDYRIAEYLYNVPWEIKNYEGREKGLLRKAMTGFLPEEVLWRKKSPFPKTHHPEYLAKVRALLEEIISSPNAPLLQICRKSALEGLLRESRETPWYGQLMTVPQTIGYFIQLNYWMQKFKLSLR